MILVVEGVNRRPVRGGNRDVIRSWQTSPARGLGKASGWEPPNLPVEVVQRTRALRRGCERLTDGEV